MELEWKPAVRRASVVEAGLDWSCPRAGFVGWKEAGETAATRGQVEGTGRLTGKRAELLAVAVADVQ